MLIHCKRTTPPNITQTVAIKGLVWYQPLPRSGIVINVIGATPLTVKLNHHDIPLYSQVGDIFIFKDTNLNLTPDVSYNVTIDHIAGTCSTNVYIPLRVWTNLPDTLILSSIQELHIVWGAYPQVDWYLVRVWFEHDSSLLDTFHITQDTSFTISLARPMAISTSIGYIYVAAVNGPLPTSQLSNMLGDGSGHIYAAYITPITYITSSQHDVVDVDILHEICSYLDIREYSLP